MKLLNRLCVVFKTTLPYLIGIEVGLGVLLGSGALDVLPSASEYVLVALSIVGGAIAFIRKVTPVPKDQRGLLPNSSTVISKS